MELLNIALHSRSPWLSPRGWGFFIAPWPYLCILNQWCDILLPQALHIHWNFILRHRLGLLGCPVQAQELDFMIPAVPFQLRIFNGSLFFQNQFIMTFQSSHLLRKLKSSSSSTPVPPNYFLKCQKLGKDDIFHLEEVSAAYFCLKAIHLYLFLCIAGHLRAKTAWQWKEKRCYLHTEQ